MPRLIPKRTKGWPADAVVVAWQSMVGDNEQGVALVVKKGEKYRGDDERVKLWPAAFVAEDTLPGDFPPEINWSAITEARDQTSSVAVSVDIPDDEACLAGSSFMAAGRWFKEGGKYRRDDPVVKENPELFTAVPAPLNQNGSPHAA